MYAWSQSRGSLRENLSFGTLLFFFFNFPAVSPFHSFLSFEARPPRANEKNEPRREFGDLYITDNSLEQCRASGKEIEMPLAYIGFFKYLFIVNS